MKHAMGPFEADEALLDGWRESFLLALTFTGHVLRIAFQNFLGAPTSRMQLLGALYTGGELSQADLQRLLEVDGATITRQVKQMESEGLLQRRADPKDNRFTLVTLTDTGREMMRGLMQRGLEFEQLALRGAEPDQIRCAVELLARMRQNIHDIAGENECQSGDAQ